MRSDIFATEMSRFVSQTCVEPQVAHYHGSTEDTEEERVNSTPTEPFFRVFRVSVVKL
jgi:hypothetical protein